MLEMKLFKLLLGPSRTEFVLQEAVLTGKYVRSTHPNSDIGVCGVPLIRAAGMVVLVLQWELSRLVNPWDSFTGQNLSID